MRRLLHQYACKRRKYLHFQSCIWTCFVICTEWLQTFLYVFPSMKSSIGLSSYATAVIIRSKNKQRKKKEQDTWIRRSEEWIKQQDRKKSTIFIFLSDKKKVKNIVKTKHTKHSLITFNWIFIWNEYLFAYWNYLFVNCALTIFFPSVFMMTEYIHFDQWYQYETQYNKIFIIIKCELLFFLDFCDERIHKFKNTNDLIMRLNLMW